MVISALFLSNTVTHIVLTPLEPESSALWEFGRSAWDVEGNCVGDFGGSGLRACPPLLQKNCAHRYHVRLARRREYALGRPNPDILKPVATLHTPTSSYPVHCPPSVASGFESSALGSWLLEFRALMVQVVGGSSWGLDF